MRKLLTITAVLGLFSPGCSGLIELQLQDFSDFNSFTWTVESCDTTYGFDVLHVMHNEDGSYTITTAVLVDGEETQVLEKTLSTTEVEQIVDLFSSVSVIATQDPACFVLDRPTCTIHDYQWDDDEIENWLCTAPRISNEQSDQINELLAALRPAAE